MTDSSEQVHGLVAILLDNEARPDERDDAAMYLGRYDEEEGLQALVQVASDPNEWDYILEVAGESIARILVRRNEYRRDIISKLYGVAKSEALGYMEVQRPDWKFD